jgi:four helix bundle protein
MQDFRKLRVWQLAHELALEVATALSPGACRRPPGLRTQAVRAAMSVGSNIAEGCGKRTPEEFHRFLEMALASLLELESHLLLARDANVISVGTFLRLEQRSTLLRRMLISFMQRVLGTVPRLADAVDSERS